MASQISYVPKACKASKGEKQRFAGVIVLRKPTFDEKYSYLAESGIQLSAEGKPAEMTDAKERIDFIRKVVGFSRKHYVSVDLTNVETEEKLTSLDDLESSGDCDDILIEIGTQVLNGFKLGNA